MIPKTIHYCWFGQKELPELATKCIESWKSVLPEYKIIRWDENNFDISSNIYVQEAYKNKKYAFVSDYVRLYAMYNFGGIYMDTDVEVLKPLDIFLHYQAFSGFENYMNIPTGIMACEKGFPNFGTLLDYYKDRHFILDNGNFDLTTNVKIITDFYLRYGLIQNNTEQLIHGFKLMPNIVFCPEKDEIKKKYMPQIYTIHHKAGSWLDHPHVQSGVVYDIKLMTKRVLKTIIGKERFESFLKKRAIKKENAE